MPTRRSRTESAQPAYGAALRRQWRFEPGLAYLNHGGYGATPLPVLAAQEEWRARIERNPTRFLSREQPAALRESAGRVAAALGAKPADLVFVENATAGINAVLRSLEWAAGDEILITSLTYPAVRKAVQHTAERTGARLVEAEIALPVADESEILAAVAPLLGNRTRLAIFDHIASASALRLPVAALIELARQAEAPVLIDGAHAAGQIALELGALGADWYIGNLHKWYFAPRGCGFLWAAPHAQHGLHPLAISHGLGAGFAAEFDWTGTRDFSACLAAPAGIEFHRQLGGAALMARNAALAGEAAAALAPAWGTELAGPSAMFAAMAAVRLPLAPAADPKALLHRLAEHGVEAAVSSDAGAHWLRISAQAYNETAEYRRLAALVAAECKA